MVVDRIGDPSLPGEGRGDMAHGEGGPVGSLRKRPMSTEDSPSRSLSPGQPQSHREEAEKRLRRQSRSPRRGRRRREGTMWDVKDSPYGFPLPPPGAAAAAIAAAISPNPNPLSAAYAAVASVGAVVADVSQGVAGIDTTALQRMLNPPVFAVSENGTATAGGIPIPIVGDNQQLTRPARRLYVGNLPPDTTEAEISDFFFKSMLKAKGVESEGNPILSVYLNMEKRFAFIELRTVNEASAALQMDGLLFRTFSLRMRRPNDYRPETAPRARAPPTFNPGLLGIVSTQVPDGPNKVFIGGIPYHLTEDQIKELLQSFGPLAAFNLIKDSNTGLSKGFGFFEYADPSVIDIACEKLNEMQLGRNKLTVRRAATSAAMAAAAAAAGVGSSLSNLMPLGGPVLTSSIASAANAIATTSPATPLRPPTAILQLENMVSEDELRDDDEFADIQEDVREEAAKYGSIQELIIPRPRKPTDTSDATDERVPGLGSIFIVYHDVNSSMSAFAAMSGRKFGPNVVVANYTSPDQLDRVRPNPPSSPTLSPTPQN
uniref:Splicing factor U2AF subunit n=1 Tax=Compsopogon caeruleus TaxID=31354 RepID=A0A7S1T4K8_9RHOD